MSLAQELGYRSEDRLLIVNADDYGLCHSVNIGIQQLLTERCISSATLMVPCAWAKEAALWSKLNPQFDIGVHFTFTSEWELYRWGPVKRAGDSTSLVDEEGYFHSDCQSFELKAESGQVYAELVAQVEMALKLGLNPSHADSHMGSLYGLETGKHFLGETLTVCAAYGLPFRLPRYVLPEVGHVAPPQMAEQAAQLAAFADSKGVVILDYLVGLPFHLQQGETYETLRADMQKLLRGLKPGVTELIIHPSQMTAELASFHREPAKRGMELELFRDPVMKDTLAEEGITLISWRQLQQLQRERTGFSR